MGKKGIIITSLPDKDGKKNVRMDFERTWLLYDIKTIAYVTADVLPPDLPLAVKQQLTDIAEEGNIDRVTREMDLAYHDCVNWLYPYTKNEITISETTDKLKESEKYSIYLSLPLEFAQITVEYLATLIHEYIVYRVLAAWCYIIYPKAAENWAIKSEDAKSKATAQLVRRLKPVYKKMSPF